MTKRTSQDLFIHDVDANTRDSIFKLDQKLRGLRAEIEFKIKSAALLQEEPKEGSSQRLSTLIQEIDLAIQAIEQLVNMVIPEDDALKNSFFESEDLREFKEALEEHINQISKIKDEF